MKLGDLSRGVVIGDKFRLVDVLGRGSFGDVWLCDVIEGENLPPQVALKIYHNQDSSRNLLLKEARQAMGYTHARVVTVFGADRIEGLFAMWMEYVPGKTLYDYIGSDEAPRPVTIEQVLSWLHDIAEALAYLHCQEPPCVHGDLKLDNVIIDLDNRARLADFGQSRTIEDRFVTTQGIGAWPYLAPEVLGAHTEGHGKRFVASDIYAFGVIAYRFLTGRFPHRSTTEVWQQIPFPRPKDLNPSIPSELDILVWKCLEKRPDKRYQSGAELLAAVEAVQSSISRARKVPLAIPERDKTAMLGPIDELAALAGRLLAAGHADQVVVQLEKAMERMPTSPRVLLIYGAAARQLNKLDVAMAVYQRALNWLTDNGVPDEELEDACEGLADVHVRLKRYEEAVKGFKWLAERWPAKRWYQYRYGVALGLAGQYKRSVEILKQLNEAEPSATICAKIGFALLQDRQEELASQYFNEALMLDAYEAVALYHLAYIKAIRGRNDKAAMYLERLRRVEGTEEEVRCLERQIGVIPGEE